MPFASTALLALALSPAHADGSEALDAAVTASTAQVTLPSSPGAAIGTAARTPSRWSLGVATGGSWALHDVTANIQFLPLEIRYFDKQRRHSVDFQIDWFRTAATAAVGAALDDGLNLQGGLGVFQHWRFPVTDITSLAVSPGLRITGGEDRYSIDLPELGTFYVNGIVEVALPVRLGVDIRTTRGGTDFGIYLRPEVGQLTLLSAAHTTMFYASLGGELSVTWNLRKR